MAEMHPVLWSRMTSRRLTNAHVRIAVLSTYEHRSFELADNPIVFTPQTDLVIMNYIANYIIQNNAVDKDFLAQHVNFRRARPISAMAYGQPIRWKKRRRIPAAMLLNR